MPAENRPIVIKKVKKAGHAHHGGAWKIAYADFVTAMMAFFLLLWLISMTTPDQKEGLSKYFAPANISLETNGTGGTMAGATASTEGAKMEGSSFEDSHAPLAPAQTVDTGSPGLGGGGTTNQPSENFPSGGDPQMKSASLESERFKSAAVSIRQAWQAMPSIAEIADNLIIEETSEGLNIQLVNQEGRSMFPEGSKYPFEVTRQAIAAIAPILQRLPNQVAITGHTAAGTEYLNARYGPWELSIDRAHAVRSLLGEFGLSDGKVNSVVGRADTDPFYAGNPYLAANERIQITVLYEPPPVPPNLKP